VRAIALAAIEAGADAFLGHHPHVLRRAALVRGKPVFYSLGNLLMRMKTGKPWTEYGALTRLTLAKSGAATIELCPYRIFGLDPVLLASDPQRQVHEPHFRATFDRLLAAASFAAGETVVALGPLDADGCGQLTPR
jgi:poly-gamma-glutamate synthesis protein (capsule biosynthesis protein)